MLGGMFKVVAFLMLVVGGVVTATFAYSSWLSSKYGAAFEQATLGSSEATVRILAGDPSYITDGTRWVEPRHVRSTSELWYEVPWVVQKFSFCFDSSGSLIHKYNWVSW
jgi:hypothetical protein